MEDSSNEDESSRPLLDTPEVAVVQPDKEKKGFDSPKEQKEERGKVPLEGELITPVDADPIQKRVHCANESPLDHYYYPDTTEFDNESLELDVDDHAESPILGSSRIPVLERVKPFLMVM
ncbi:uncharacterized protein LOC116298158 isoform X1 [Actinia tenebrosa]|uniref:Uncharacterized protein LOC116298158 isoform X1 n=1 Tax=Actinia tenebrosa TaxID=6105 RepID=A0A6P8IBX5_ACTTE|nr:uncharacterized protein LOC116298158 isoform X1 [Actinia tenebrosa]